MTAPAGFSGQVGFKSETTFGTGVTPDQFVPFLKESLKQQIARLDSKGIRAGRRTVARWRPGAKTVGGDLEFELPNVQLATVLKHMFGDVATTGVGPFTHTATPGDLTGESLTIQVGRPDVGGTVRPFTYAGSKIASWEISASAGELATLTLEISAQSETTATALAAASYDADLAPFTFVEGSLSVAGSAVATVRQMSLKGSNALDTERHRIGSAVVAQQLEAGMREYAGTVVADFEGLTAYERYVNGTEAALVMAFSNGTDSLTITCNVRFDGETPTIGGADELLEQPLPFACVSSTSDAAAIKAVLVNDEASAA